MAIPDFNIEIKSDPEYDSVYSPTVNEFCELVILEIKRSSLLSKCMIQSFDSRALKYIHQKYPEVKLVYLTESLSNVNDVKKVLGFLALLNAFINKLQSDRPTDEMRSAFSQNKNKEITVYSMSVVVS